MVRKGNLAIFESNNISETGEATPTKICVHAFDINPYLHDFFEPIPNDSIFWRPCHGPKGKFGCFESGNISKTGEAMPTIIGVQSFDINLYLHEFFEPIPID